MPTTNKSRQSKHSKNSHKKSKKHCKRDNCHCRKNLRTRTGSKYFCFDPDRLIKVFPEVNENGATQFLCFSHPISGFQARKPNRIGCPDQKKKKETYVYCCHCHKTFKVKKIDTTNKLGCFANIDFEHDKVYNCFSQPNVQTDRRIRRIDPNLKYRTRPVKLRKNSKDLCPGLCKKCLYKPC